MAAIGTRSKRAVSPDHGAAQQAEEGGLGGAGARPALALESQSEAHRSRQPSREQGGEAIAWHHIETHPRKQGDAALARRAVVAMEQAEDLDLAGDVEVMHALSEAGLKHRRGGLGEGAGAVEHRRHLAQPLSKRRGIIERKSAPGKTEPVGEGADFARVSAGEGGFEPALRRLFGDELAGIARRPVDQPGTHVPLAIAIFETSN